MPPRAEVAWYIVDKHEGAYGKYDKKQVDNRFKVLSTGVNDNSIVMLDTSATFF
jgi:hypothetical protein